MTKKLRAAKHETLPHSVIECEILPRLRFRTLQRRCMLVSKSWRRSIKDPGFAVLHTKHARDNVILVFADFDSKVFRTFNIINDELVPLRIPIFNVGNYYLKPGVLGFVGTCNGLISFYIRHDNRFVYYLYNPTIQVVRLFHVIDTPDGIIGDKEGHGLGFNSEKNEYKCVTILRHGIYVFSTKTGMKIKDSPLSKHNLIETIGVQAKNSLHWIYGNDYGTEPGVLNLDLETDLFSAISLPYCNGRARIMTIRGDLHVVYTTYVMPQLHDSYKIVLWQMKDNGFSNRCWVKLYEVKIEDMPYSTIPISFLEGGRKVLLELWKDKLPGNHKSYIWYDLVTKESEKCVDVLGRWTAYPCLETLIDPRYV